MSAPVVGRSTKVLPSSLKPSGVRYRLALLSVRMPLRRAPSSSARLSPAGEVVAQGRVRIGKRAGQDRKNLIAQTPSLGYGPERISSAW